MKKLVRDYCTSNYNLCESRWPKLDASERTEIQNLLHRLDEEMNLKVSGMNVHLQWDTGSDLDINVQCPCGNWHGYGTSGGSGGSCRCDTC